MESLTGREATTLALLAQAQHLSNSDKRKILNTLTGRALRIAKAILGETKHPSKSIQAAADGFISWAKALPAREF